MMDNCSSHKSDEIARLCRENNVQIVFFVANATHIFQPLDLCMFGEFKKRIASIVAQRVSDDQTNRLFRILQTWDDVNKVARIQASFEMGGFVYNIVENRVTVSFSSESVRNIQNDGLPAPPASGRRIRIDN